MTHNARIVGQRLFTPDPKNHPNLELMKLELDIQPAGGAATDKNSKGYLIVNLESAEQFPLRSYLRITVEDSQQVLPLGGATAARKRDREAKGSDVH
jgi:hypothetical protein